MWRLEMILYNEILTYYVSVQTCLDSEINMVKSHTNYFGLSENGRGSGEYLKPIPEQCC